MVNIEEAVKNKNKIGAHICTTYSIYENFKSWYFMIVSIW